LCLHTNIVDAINKSYLQCCLLVFFYLYLFVSIQLIYLLFPSFYSLKTHTIFWMVYGRKRQEIREELDEDDDPKGPGFLQLGAAQKVHGIQRGPGRRDSDQGAERPKVNYLLLAV
jgi:hypothetical protein